MRSQVEIFVYCYLVRDRHGIILIDAGGGPLLGPEFGKIRQEMDKVGISPGDVRLILLTHIHPDHALGLIDENQAYFPEADVLVPRADFEFFTDPFIRAQVDEDHLAGFSIAEQLREQYGSRISLIDDGVISPNIEALPLPGHTPGHTGFLLSGSTAPLFIWGDLVHLPQSQLEDPDIGLAYDYSPQQAAMTRRSTLGEASEKQWIVAGGHVELGRVYRRSEGFLFSQL